MCIRIKTNIQQENVLPYKTSSFPVVFLLSWVLFTRNITNMFSTFRRRVVVVTDQEAGRWHHHCVLCYHSPEGQWDNSCQSPGGAVVNHRTTRAGLDHWFPRTWEHKWRGTSQPVHFNYSQDSGGTHLNPCRPTVQVEACCSKYSQEWYVSEAMFYTFYLHDL